MMFTLRTPYPTLRSGGGLLIMIAMLLQLCNTLNVLRAGAAHDLPGAAPASTSQLSTAEWGQIAPLMREAEYQATPRARADGRAAFWAPNRLNGFSLNFGPDGLDVAPWEDQHRWSLSLRTAAYGPAGAAVALSGAPTLSADKQRVEYRWPGLREWYINSAAGLKHNVTLEQPIAAEQLQVDLAVGGTLRPQLREDGRAVAFVDRAGARVLDFGALYVYDAAGRTLEARFGTPRGGGTTLPILVKASGAQFPITIDPLLNNPRPKLVPSTSQSSASFGTAMAADGEVLVVGAHFEDGPGADSGAVYVFIRNHNGADQWGQVRKLLPAIHAGDDRFGFSVAVDGDLIVVGAPSTNQRANNDGAAYIFQRHRGGSDAWGEVARLAGSRASADDLFGQAVAISGDAIAVGAPQEDSGASNAGGVYLFTIIGAIVTEVQFVQGSTPSSGDQFGFAVAMDGPTLVVGAPFKATPQAGRGAAFVFERHRSAADRWHPMRQLGGSDTAGGDSFGRAVTISSDTIVVGAPGHNVSDAADRGAAYLFTRNQGGTDAWGQSRKLLAFNGAAFDQFGMSLAASSEVVVVGAPRDDNEARGLIDSGRVVIFVNGVEFARLTAPDGAADDRFGEAVAISGDLVAAGAPRHDAGSTNSGAAYLFTLDSERWDELRLLDGATRCCNFGEALALDDETLAVGAPGGPTGGSVFIFHRNQGGTGAWGEVAQITNPRSGSADNFGGSLALDDNLLAVGTTQGLLYIFERNRGGADRWGEQRRISLNTRGVVSLALSGDELQVGEPLTGQAGVGIETGQVEIFERHRGGFNSWGRRTVVTVANFGRTPQERDNFGRAVAFDGTTSVFTAAEEPSTALPRANQGVGYVGKTRLAPSVATPGFGGAALVDGDTIVIGTAVSLINGSLQPGAASVFRRNQGGPQAWGEVKRLLVPDGSGNFGRALGLDGGWLAVGAEVSLPHGRVSLYERNIGGADAWGLIGSLRGSRTAERSTLGEAVALDGNWLAASEDNHVYLFFNSIRSPAGLGLQAPKHALQPGEAVTVSAAISGETGATEGKAIGLGVPQGEVAFFLDGAPAGTAQLDAQGQAQITLPGLAQGRYELTARFAGNDNWAPCEAPSLTLFVGMAAPPPNRTTVFLPLVLR